MTESQDESQIPWDEVVDVICVGTSPGVLAYGICCARNDLDVLLVQPPVTSDDRLAAWYAAMTSDLSPELNPGREGDVADRQQFSFARVVPPPPPSGKRAPLEPFVGENLRLWAAHCLASPFGVMFTQVPELLLPMRGEGGESVTAALIGSLGGGELVSWIMDCAHEEGLDDPQNIMAAMVLEEGRIAGVELDDGYQVATRGGLVLPVNTSPAIAEIPRGGDCTVAIVGRPAGRFATVDLLRQ